MHDRPDLHRNDISKYRMLFGSLHSLWVTDRGEFQRPLYQLACNLSFNSIEDFGAIKRNTIEFQGNSLRIFCIVCKNNCILRKILKLKYKRSVGLYRSLVHNQPNYHVLTGHTPPQPTPQQQSLDCRQKMFEESFHQNYPWKVMAQKGFFAGTVTLTVEIWPWVNAITHHGAMDNCVKHYLDPTGQ